MNPEEERIRQDVVKRYLAGESPKSISTSVGRSKRWLFKWIARYQTGDPHWSQDLSRAPKIVHNRADPEMEDLICTIRKELDDEDEFYGAQSILWYLEDMALLHIPSLRTINRILKRKGLIQPRDKRYRPKGKVYPAIEAKRPNYLHQMDIFGPRYLKGPVRFYSANVMDICTHRVAINPVESRNSRFITRALVATWKRLGIPKYLQLDNHISLRGSNRYPRSFGSVIKLCLHLGIEPVFIPLNEPWRNGSIEKFQDFFKAKFLGRVHMVDFSFLLKESMHFENRHNSRYRYSFIKGKTPIQALECSRSRIRMLESDFQIPDMRKRPPRGRIHLIRFIRSARILDVFGEKFRVSEKLVYEYVRATIFVKEQKLRLFLDGNQVDEFKYNLS